MTKFKSTIALRMILFMIFSVSIIIAGRPFEKQKDTRSELQKVTANDVFTPMSINNIFSYYVNNGDGSLNPFTGDGGFELINANRGLTIFEEGFVWGGKHLKDTVVKVGGSTYNHGLQAGRIITPGTTTSAPVADNVANANIFRVRPDIGPSVVYDLAMEDKINREEVSLISKYETFTAKQIFDRYVADWNNWPASQGAPFLDKNNNGTYQPATDVPGVSGADQTIWYVANDLDIDRAYYLSGSKPIGIEFQRTIWAYKRTGALGNTVFQKNIIINKSGYRIDSMYVAQWSDPDLGGGLGYTDDVTGCDTTLGLGFVYNGDNSDGFFGSKAPAAGFDFFQGPLIPGNPSDSGKVDGKYVKGKKNLGMTAFNFFINGNTTYADPRLQDPRGTTEWYNLMKGLVGRTGAAYTNPKTNLRTKFVLSGDPVLGTGWIDDGSIAPPGDRRMASCSGPFTMAAGDTQEIVVAAIIGQGNNRLSSVSVLKFYDEIAQLAYDANFNLPSAPQSPVVQVGELDKQIILRWSDSTASKITEGQNDKGYKFQGYNLYQLPTSSFNNGVRLGTFDKKDGVLSISDRIYDEAVGTVVTKPVQFGSDFGVARHFVINDDLINGKKLVNGQSYYFAVTAYNYNPDPNAIPRTIESSPLVIKVIPQSPKPGIRVNISAGSLITGSYVTPISPADGSIVSRVIDPTKITGDTYEVRIDTIRIANVRTKVWSVFNVTKNTSALGYQTTYGDDSVSNPIVDGIQWSVIDPGAAGGFKQALLIKNGSTDLSANPPNIMRAKDPNGAWAMDALSSTSRAHAFARAGASFEGANDYEIRITGSTTPAGSQYYNAAFQLGVGDPVFAGGRLQAEVYEVTSVPAKRLIINVRDVNANGFSINTLEANSSLIVNGTDGREWDALYVQDPASAGYYAEPLPNPSTKAAAGFAFRRIAFFSTDTLVTTFPVPVGTVIRLNTNKPMLPGVSKFVVNTSALKNSFSAALATKDVQKVNVFPNPYFGLNTKEVNKYNKFVTFNHLPPKATLSIINLAGVRVKKLVKDDTEQFMKWDLTNEAGLPVASGMYVIYVDMGSLGTKILKFAVIQELQQLDKY